MFVNQPYSDVVVNMELIYFGLALILSSLFFKLAVAPFHVWAPSVYEGSPTTITAFLSVAPKAAGFALFLRMFFFVFTDGGSFNAVNPILNE